MPKTRSWRGAALSALLAGMFCLAAGTPAALATPVGACGTLSASGNYELTQNLSASGDCLVLTSSNIAIDLKGHRITGDGSGAAITDGGNAIRYIVVANGKISNFTTGIDLPTDSGQTSDLIAKMNVSGNGADGIHVRGRDNNLANVNSSNNGGNGVDLGACCDSLYKVVTNGNGGDGVHFQSEDYLLSVKATENGGDGVRSEGGDELVVKSSASKNGGAGFALHGSDSLVVSSTANGNNGDGFTFSSTFGHLTNSKAGKNQGDGAHFQNEFGLVTSVTANGNSGAGVFLTCAGNAVRVKAKGNATNLDEDTSGGMCTNVLNNAP